MSKPKTKSQKRANAIGSFFVQRPHVWTTEALAITLDGIATQSDAGAEYTKTQRDVAAQIDALKLALSKHVVRNATRAVDWADVGDLTETRARLRDTLRFLAQD